MHVKVISVLAALALLAGAAPAAGAAPRLYQQGLALGEGEASEAPVKASGTLKLSGAPIGVEICRFHAGGGMWNPVGGGYGLAGVLEGMAAYHCQQQLPASEPGCHRGFRVLIEVPEANEGEAQNTVYVEPAGLQLELGGAGSYWRLKCGPVVMPVTGRSQFGLWSQWENGSCKGACPAQWRPSGSLPIRYETEPYTLAVALNLSIAGEESGQFLMFR